MMNGIGARDVYIDHTQNFDMRYVCAIRLMDVLNSTFICLTIFFFLHFMNESRATGNGPGPCEFKV